MIGQGSPHQNSPRPHQENRTHCTTDTTQVTITVTNHSRECDRPYPALPILRFRTYVFVSKEHFHECRGSETSCGPKALLPQRQRLSSPTRDACCPTQGGATLYIAARFTCSRLARASGLGHRNNERKSTSGEANRNPAQKQQRQQQRQQPIGCQSPGE